MITNAFTFLCLFTTLAGPPGFYLENNAYLALYPIDRILCPEIERRWDIVYELYTTSNRNESKILILDDDESIVKSQIDFSKNTVIYFHGFMEGGSYGSAKVVREAYMQRNDHNFLVVNAQRLLAGPWYFTASRNTRAVGIHAAKMIDFLVEKGMYLNKVHLIGHSLGSQSAGVAGQNIKSGKVARITGLDPAKPLFENAPLEIRLDQSDAHFVDIIHTASGTFGMQSQIGHADFYPNGGGAVQPGCQPMEIYNRNPNSLLEQIFCSHWRSFYFYAESVLKPDSFTSTPCDSWKNYTSGNCNDNCRCIYMGFGVSNIARGKYYLNTNKKEPFSKF